MSFKVANKEAIICGWHLIKKDLKKFKTTFVPVDSEHFSIYYALKGNKISNIDKILDEIINEIYN